MDVSPEALSELKQASPDAHVPVRAPQTPRAPPPFSNLADKKYNLPHPRRRR